MPSTSGPTPPVYLSICAIFRDEGPPYTGRFSVKQLRINHYATRSEEEFCRKATRWKADTGQPPIRPIPVDRVLRNFDKQTDETILSYLPALREAMQDAPVSTS